MHYTSEYLSWQMGFPGEEPAKLAMAFLDGMPIGCAGVTPRRLVQGGAVLPAYVLSFVGVAPLARGRGLAGSLYEALLDRRPAERLEREAAGP
jgi:GNAT superfamily N-acetyltransferase